MNKQLLEKRKGYMVTAVTVTVSVTVLIRVIRAKKKDRRREYPDEKSRRTAKRFARSLSIQKTVK